jgi:ribonucleotide reductase beta subunit family protein with ferritin-like domain
MAPRLKTPCVGYVIDYPTATEFADKQLDVFWHWNEIKVKKDIHDMKTALTPAEYHGVITVLKLFTLYELIAGSEYWGKRVMEEFPRPDIQRMASAFSFFELNVHAPFYREINKLLGLDVPSFYEDYVEDETLKSRMEFIDEFVEHKDLLTSLAVFSMVEGAVLYSSFAFLKHFQAEGKNLLTNITAGIDFSVRDENLHSMGGAWLYQALAAETKESPEKTEARKKAIYAAAEAIYEHECRIVDMIFEKGTIRGITVKQMKYFVQSRIDLCLGQIGLEPIYNVGYNPIGNWFYKNINGGRFHDFFVTVGSEYNRNWEEKGFVWKTEEAA